LARIRNSDKVIHCCAHEGITVTSFKKWSRRQVRIDHEAFAIEHHDRNRQCVERSLKPKSRPTHFMVLGTQIPNGTLNSRKQIIEPREIDFCCRFKAQSHCRLIDMISLRAIPEKSSKKGRQCSSKNCRNQRTNDG
jgi:hypothetical protein